MIQTICRNCNEVFWLPVVMYALTCPYCGSQETYIAVWNEEMKDYEAGKKI